MRAALRRSRRQREDERVLRVVCHGAHHVLIKHEGRWAAQLVAADQHGGPQGLYRAEQVGAVCWAAVAVGQLVVLQRAAVTPA